MTGKTAGTDARTFCVVTDIFGITKDTLQLAQRLGDAVIIDPYNGERPRFFNESEAYTFFMKNCGMDKYADTAERKISSLACPCVTVGFSVGATSLWRAAAGSASSKILKAYCFYGSRIRDFRELKPKCPVHLIFPDKEEFFDVDELISALSVNKNAEFTKVRQHHGFMNRLSVNYDSEAYEIFMEKLLQA
jgi:dienelactone hydrolase